MIKTITAAVAIAVGSVATAGEVDLTSVTGEYRTSDYGNQYKLQADLKVSDVDGFRFYGEVEAMEKHSRVRSGDTVNLTAGASLPLSVGKFSVVPFVQVGDKVQDLGKDTFYAGVGASASVPVTGKWSAEASYRRRFDLWGADVDEDRVSLFAKYDLTKNGVLSGGIHNYSGSTTDKRWAVAYTYKF
jgi:hypothetical protein